MTTAKIHFDVFHWKEIMQRAGGFVASFASRKALEYILLICEENFCTAYASDAEGYTFVRMRVPCKMDDPHCRLVSLLKPEKVPAKTVAVDVLLPQVIKEAYTVTIQYYRIGQEQETVEKSVQTIPDDPSIYPQYEKVLNNTIQKQKQEYFISFRLDVLLRALSAFKGKDKESPLIFHFGNQVQPVIIEPGKDENYPEITTLICPARIFNYDGGIRNEG